MTAASDTTVSVPLIRISIQYSGVKLDKLESNYKEWCDDVTIALSLNGLYEYVSGDTSPPPDTEVRAAANWASNARIAFAFLASSVATGERLFLDMTKGPNANWKVLQD